MKIWMKRILERMRILHLSKGRYALFCSFHPFLPLEFSFLKSYSFVKMPVCDGNGDT